MFLNSQTIALVFTLKPNKFIMIKKKVVLFQNHGMFTQFVNTNNADTWYMYVCLEIGKRRLQYETIRQGMQHNASLLSLALRNTIICKYAVLFKLNVGFFLSSWVGDGLFPN